MSGYIPPVMSGYVPPNTSMNFPTFHVYTYSSFEDIHIKLLLANKKV